VSWSTCTLASYSVYMSCINTVTFPHFLCCYTFLNAAHYQNPLCSL
jgi:hypothetical protein